MGRKFPSFELGGERFAANVEMCLNQLADKGPATPHDINGLAMPCEAAGISQMTGKAMA